MTSLDLSGPFRAAQLLLRWRVWHPGREIFQNDMFLQMFVRMMGGWKMLRCVV